MKAMVAWLLGIVFAAGACSGAGSPAPTPSVAGSLFNGDGFTVMIPDDPAFTYSRASGGDTWATASQPTMALSIYPVRNLLPGSQSLEGALGRAQQGIAAVEGASTPTISTVALPTGGAYRLDATASVGTIREYALYRNQTAWLVSFINFPPALSDQVIQSLVLT